MLDASALLLPRSGGTLGSHHEAHHVHDNCLGWRHASRVDLKVACAGEVEVGHGDSEWQQSWKVL
jgi:hypothetical protein